MVDTQEFEILIAIITGPVSAVIAAWLAYYFALKQIKRNVVSPYFMQLYGIVDRILRNEEAKFLNERYHSALIARERWAEEGGSGIPGGNSTIKDYFIFDVNWLLFLASFHRIFEVIEECREFEKVYEEMENKGLISTLKKHQPGLHNYLNLAKSSAHYINDATKGISKESDKNDISELENILISGSDENKKLAVLWSINTNNIFFAARELRKYLEKIVV